MVGIRALIKRLWGEDSAQALDDEQTGDARIGQLKREFAEHPSKGLTPARLYEILEAAEQGDLKAQHELFEDMEEKDPQIAADLAKRRQLAAELEWQIVPPDDATPREKQAAEFCAEVFGGIEVEDLIIDMGSGIGHGWSHLEMVWARDGARRYIEQPVFRPHSWFQLHPDAQDRLTLRDMSHTGAELWPLGWVQHRHRAKAGYVARAGLHRVLAWPYLFQNYALGDLAELLEIYGMPARIGTYPRNASDREKATLLRAVTSLGHRAAGIIPEGMMIDYKDVAAGKAEPYVTMLQWCERAKAKAILGGTLTSGTGEGTNTNALGNVHERGQQSLIRSDARQYAGTINRDILWPLAALNFGIEDRRRAPRFYLDTGEAQDLKHLAETLPVFVDMGAQIPMWWFHEKSRIPKAGAREDVLRPRDPFAGQGFGAMRAAPRAAVLSLPRPAPDAGEAQLERLQTEGDAAVEEWIDQVRQLVQEVGSLEELRDRLIEIYPRMDPERFAQVMGDALAAAHLAGRYDILEGA